MHTGEVLQEFLNSLLCCPLPKGARDVVIQFLEIEESMQWEFSTERNKKDDSSSRLMSKDHAREIASMTSACHSELLRAQSRIVLAQRLDKFEVEEPPSPTPATPKKNLSRSDSGPMSPAPYLDPLLPTSISDGLRDAMHEALMTVMAERDEAQAQLIAASVLHVHEMESERKKMDLLNEKLRHTQEGAKKEKQGLFADRFKRQPSENSLHKYQEQIIQSTDSELVGLCQQLAGEISAKTSASLEVIRLKESRKIEREQDAAAKEALQEELRKAREQLAAEQEKSLLATEETQKWKEMAETQNSK